MEIAAGKVKIIEFVPPVPVFPQDGFHKPNNYHLPHPARTTSHPSFIADPPKPA